MSNHETSTGQSYLEKATGAIQSGIGSLTGNTADRVQGENRKEVADTKHDLSHTAAKAGPFSVTPEGGVAKDSSDRTNGAWNQNVGAAKEAVGGFLGAEGLKQEGARQNAEGKEQEAAGQVEDLGKGIGDRVGGVVGKAVAGVTGNEEQKMAAERQHDEGKARQRGVEVELQKRAEAERA